MCKLFVLLLLGLGFVSADKCPYGFDDGMDDLKTLTAKGIRLWGEPGWEHWLDAYATPFSAWIERSRKNVIAGKTAMLNFRNGWLAASPDMKADVTWCMRSGDVVECTWRVSGTHSGPLGKIGATGRKFDLTGTWVVIWAAGKISFIQNHWDMLDFYQQVGILKDPAVDGVTNSPNVGLTHKCIDGHLKKMFGDSEEVDMSDYTEASVSSVGWDNTHAFKGIEGIKSLYMHYKKVLKGVKWEIKSVVSGVNNAAVDVAFTVEKQVGDLGQIKGKGQSIPSYSCSLFLDSIVGEKILAERWNCDWLPIVRAGGGLTADPLKQ